MKDGIVLHPEYGVNPSIEICIVCGEEMGIALLGNGIKGQAPHHICTGEVCDNCKKIIDEGGKAEYCERYYKRVRIVFLLIYFIHQIKFWVLACRFVRIGMSICVS